MDDPWLDLAADVGSYSVSAVCRECDVLGQAATDLQCLHDIQHSSDTWRLSFHLKAFVTMNIQGAGPCETPMPIYQTVRFHSTEGYNMLNSFSTCTERGTRAESFKEREHEPTRSVATADRTGCFLCQKLVSNSILYTKTDKLLNAISEVDP
jgi:hypothetical protein